MGSRYHGQLMQSHSGYDTDLPDGSVTGSNSDCPGPLLPRLVFDELSPDIKEPGKLAPADIPHIFQHHPLWWTGVQGSAIGKIMEQRMAEHGHQHGRKDYPSAGSPHARYNNFLCPKTLGH